MHDTRSFLCILVHVFQHNIWGSLLVLVSFGKSRQIREAAMRAHTEVSVSDRIEDLFCARPWTQTVLQADEVIMVWTTNPQ